MGTHLQCGKCRTRPIHQACKSEHPACGGCHHVLVSWQICHGAGVAEPADVRVYQVWVTLVQRLVIQPEIVQRAPAEVEHDDVGYGA